MKLLQSPLVTLLSIVALVLSSLYFLHSSICKDTPMEIKYKTHDYIYFPHKGIVHSPDCKQCQIIFD